MSTEVNVKLTDDIVKEFPLVTFCPEGMIKFIDYLKVSGSNSRNFFTALIWALENGLNLEWDILEKSIAYDINLFIDSVYVKVNDKEIQLDSDSIWSRVYHRQHGVCYTLDIRKDFQVMEKTQGSMSLSFAYVYEPAYWDPQSRPQFVQYPSKTGFIYLHGPMDLSSAQQHSSTLYFQSFVGVNDWIFYAVNTLEYYIAKIEVETEPTKNFP